MTAKTRVCICKKFSFSAAHKSIGCSEACAKLHGHNYKVAVFVSGKINKAGVIIDLKDLGCVLKEKVINPLDHSFLNEVLRDINPTLENLVCWIWNKANEAIEAEEFSHILIEKIIIEETDTCSAVIERVKE